MPKGMIPFALLSRKGKYTKVETISLPETSSLVINTRQRMLDELNARSEVKETTIQRMID